MRFLSTVVAVTAFIVVGGLAAAPKPAAWTVPLGVSGVNQAMHPALVRDEATAVSTLLYVAFIDNDAVLAARDSATGRSLWSVTELLPTNGIVSWLGPIAVLSQPRLAIAQLASRIVAASLDQNAATRTQWTYAGPRPGSIDPYVAYSGVAANADGVYSLWGAVDAAPATRASFAAGGTPSSVRTTGLSNQTLQLVCLDVHSGSVKWTVDMGRPLRGLEQIAAVPGYVLATAETAVVFATTPGAKATPLWSHPAKGYNAVALTPSMVLATKCDVAALTTFVEARAVATGRVLWRQNVSSCAPDSKLFFVKLRPDAIADDGVVVGVLGSVAALRLSDGHVMWNKATLFTTGASSNLGHAVYGAMEELGMSAFDAATGAQTGSYNTQEFAKNRPLSVAADAKTAVVTGFTFVAGFAV